MMIKRFEAKKVSGHIIFLERFQFHIEEFALPIGKFKPNALENIKR
jgi:hypothetical protein